MRGIQNLTGALSDLDDFIHPLYPLHHPLPPFTLTRPTHDIHNNINNTPRPPLLTAIYTHASCGFSGGPGSDGVYEPVCERLWLSSGSVGLGRCVGGFGVFEWGYEDL
jgi:hypothetical protein